MTWIGTRDVFRALAPRRVSFRTGECRATERMTGVEPALDQLGRLALCQLSFIRARSRETNPGPVLHQGGHQANRFPRWRATTGAK